MTVLLIRVLDGEAGRNPTPTGETATVTEGGVRRCLDPALAESVVSAGMAYVTAGAWRLLGLEHAGEESA